MKKAYIQLSNLMHCYSVFLPKKSIILSVFLLTAKTDLNITAIIGHRKDVLILRAILVSASYYYACCY